MANKLSVFVIVTLSSIVLSCSEPDKDTESNNPITESISTSSDNVITKTKPKKTYEECLEENKIDGKFSFAGKVMCSEFQE